MPGSQSIRAAVTQRLRRTDAEAAQWCPRNDSRGQRVRRLRTLKCFHPTDLCLEAPSPQAHGTPPWLPPRPPPRWVEASHSCWAWGGGLVRGPWRTQVGGSDARFALADRLLESFLHSLHPRPRHPRLSALQAPRLAWANVPESIWVPRCPHALQPGCPVLSAEALPGETSSARTLGLRTGPLPSNPSYCPYFPRVPPVCLSSPVTAP